MCLTRAYGNDYRAPSQQCEGKTPLSALRPRASQNHQVRLCLLLQLLSRCASLVPLTRTIHRRLCTSMLLMHGLVEKKINTKPLPNPWRQDETKPSFGGGADPFGHILQPGMTFPAMNLGQGSPAGNGKGRASNGGLPNPFLTLPRRPRPADSALTQATEDFSRLRISRSSPYVRPVGPIASQQQQQHRQQGSRSRRSPGSGLPVTDRPSNIQHLDTSSRK